MYIRKVALIIFLVSVNTFLISQNKIKIDSLNKLLNRSATDTSRAKILSQIAFEYKVVNPDTSTVIIEKAIDLAKNCNDSVFHARLWEMKAGLIIWQSRYDESKKLLENSLRIFQKSNLQKDVAAVYYDLANISKSLGNMDDAIKKLLIALQISESINNIKLQGQCLGLLGQAYRYKKDFNKCLDYTLKALNIEIALKNDQGIGHSYTDLGIIYSDMNRYKEAQESYLKSIEYKKKIGDLLGVAINLNNLSSVYTSEKNYQEALIVLNEALAIFKNAKSDYWIGIAIINIADVYKNTGDFEKAKASCLVAIELAYKVKFLELKVEGYNLLSEIQYSQNQFKEAYESHKQFTILKDSMLNETSSKQINEANAKYETAKKDREIAFQNFEIKNHLLEAEKSKSERLMLFSGIGLLVLFVWLVYSRLRITRKQKKEIEEQKKLVDIKNKEVKDSITYAQYIQNAILPPLPYIKKYLPEIFILYKPKDIVAGDFYWFEVLKDNSIILAVADCTGHGVPGAMVSVVCNNALNSSVHEFGLTNPGEILNKTRELVVETFTRSNKDMKDGMDISLVKITEIKQENSDKMSPGKLILNKGESLKDYLNKKRKFKIEWSGANNPLWYFKDDQLSVLKAHKQAIGKTDNASPFPTHTFELNFGDFIYLHTDGFSDQFGGINSKKYKFNRLLQLLSSIKELDVNEQKTALNNSFENWKGNLEQVDDVTIIGFRLS